MKIRTGTVDIRLAIQDSGLIVHAIPSPGMNALPHCYVFEFDNLPMDVLAWINVIERKFAKGEPQ